MKSRICWGLCVSLLLASSLSAADTTFTGAASDLWSDADNWSNGIPGEQDKAKITNGVTCILDYDAGLIKNAAFNNAPGLLRLVDGAQLTVSQWTIVGYSGGEEGNRHILEVLGGVYNGGDPSATNNGRIYIGRQGFAQLVIDYSGVVNQYNQPFQIGQGTGGDGIVEIRGGSLNLLSNASLPLVFRAGTNSKAKMDFSGGVMTQAYSDARLANVNDHIADGTITAYDGVGTVVVETVGDQLIVKGLHPFNPVPADSITVVPGSITLEWTVDAGTPVDVWFGTTGDDFTKIVDKQTVTSVQVDAVKGTRYFWAVDTYAPGAADPNLGPLFDFYADNLAPVVDAGANVTTWLDNGSVEVALTGTVTDADPTTSVWTVVSQPDDPNSADAVIADPAALNTSITLSALGQYVLELQADDGEYQAMDTLTINVYIDSCEAAKSLPGYVPLVGDLDGDCDVDQDDVDLLLENWLNCVSLGQCDPNDPNAL